MTNLLDNAISFSPEGGVVTVRARRVGDEVEIVVDDDGPGIPPDQLENIFERFYSDRPAIGQHPRQELRPRPEHLARYHRRLRRAHRGEQSPCRRSLPSPPRSPRPQGPPQARRCRHPLHRASAAAARHSPKGRPAACPTRLRWFTARALLWANAGRCCAAPRGAASPTWRCASFSWRDAARLRIEAPALVADDQVELARDGDRVLAAAPQSIRASSKSGASASSASSRSPSASWCSSSIWSQPEEMERLPAPDVTAPPGRHRPASHPAGAVRELRSDQACAGSGARGPQLTEMACAPAHFPCLAHCGPTIMRLPWPGRAAEEIHLPKRLRRGPAN